MKALQWSYLAASFESNRVLGCARSSKSMHDPAVHSDGSNQQRVRQAPCFRQCVRARAAVHTTLFKFSQSHLACSVSAPSKSPRGFCSHSQSAGLPSSNPIISLLPCHCGTDNHQSPLSCHSFDRRLTSISCLFCCNPCRAVSTCVCVLVSSAASSVLIWICRTGSILSGLPPRVF